MRSIQVVVLTVFVVLGLLLVACGSNGAATVSDRQKIAVVMSGSWDDDSWNAAAYQALEALHGKGIEVAFTDNVGREEAREVLREYADQGNTLIIGHAAGFRSAVIGVAAEKGRANFAWAGDEDRASGNVVVYDHLLYEAAYPIGVLAAHVSESDWFGALIGELPMCRAIANAFSDGVRSVRRESGMATLAIGDWEDAAKARELVLQYSSADFWITCGPGPLLGAIEATRELGGYVTGFGVDMSEKAPDVVLVSLVWNLEPLYLSMLESIEAGAFGNTFYRMGVADDVVQVVYNSALKDSIPAEGIAAADQALADIKSGALVVPYNTRR